jgi:ubiquinone/menaquinone biosynthesis C-methylase UbiE
MATLDVYRITDKLDDAISEVLVKRLEARGRHPAFLKMMHEYLDAMHVDSAATVLDLGSGTGVAARAIAGRPRFNGTVVGIDHSAYLVRVARELATQEGLSGSVEFQIGNSHRLDFADATFDAVTLHTLISHVEDPPAVLREARRLVKPGGVIGLFDGDYASVTFAQEDPVKAREDDEAIIQAIVTNPRIMRQLPRLMGAADLELVAFFPHLIAEAGKADFWSPAITSFRALLPKAGAMSEAKAVAWADDMMRASDAGVFFGASNYYAYVMRRPHGT